MQIITPFADRRNSTVSTVSTLSSVMSEVGKMTKTNWKCFGFTIQKRVIFAFILTISLIASLGIGLINSQVHLFYQLG